MASVPEPQAVLAWSARLCCVGIFLQATEIAALWPELRDRHLLGWLGSASGRLALWRAVQRAQGFPWSVIILVARALAALACLVLPFGESRLVWLALVALFASQLYFNRRFLVFFANSDHVTLFCLAGLAVAAWPGESPTLRLAAAMFISFQACLGYVASGGDKLLAANWRSGARLVSIFQDSSHRVPWLGRWLAAQPSRAALLTWGVILLEVLFPLCLVLPAGGFWLFIGAGLVFHASIAILMSLPGFFWAFAATYPALFVVHAWLASRIAS